MQFSTITKAHRTHALVWTCFIAYEVLVVGFVTGTFGSFPDYFIHYVLNIGLFYLHAKIILPYALQKNKKQVVVLPVLVTAVIALYVVIIYTAELLLTQFLGVTMLRPLVLDYNYILRSTWRAIYFMGFATGYYFLINVLKERRRAEQAEKQHLLEIIEKQNLQHELIRSQNAFLKAQINPHFLFNTLSFVYNSVRKTSAQAAEAVLSLSHMMRYALQSEDEFEDNDLLEEIEHVESLIHIHQLRHAHKLHIQLTYGDNLAGVKLIPLVLITLVENVFKHGDITLAEHPAQINIIFADNILRITTVNRKTSGHPAGHRIGLSNIRSRLHRAYQDRARFRAQPDERGYFCVSLEIADPNTAGHLQR
jgi:two-component system, LytTR family, sensor kinase